MLIHVAVVEDQKETCDMLVALINGSDQCVCAGSYANAEDAIRHIPDINPDVVLMDIHLPNQSGVQAVAQLKQQLPGTQFIMCTSLEDSETIFASLKAGATGYITKSTQSAKILEAIIDAHNGGSPMSSQIARKVVSAFSAEVQKANKELEKLSQREQEILDYLSKGYRYKEIASLLHISIETVRKHIHNIYEKLQVNSKIDALNKVNYRHS
jgi:RNA polymerase sigma factor (sigma-70 family)